jgi:hypothetical protein
MPSAIACAPTCVPSAFRRVARDRFFAADRQCLTQFETDLAQKRAFASDRNAKHPRLVLDQVEKTPHVGLEGVGHTGPVDVPEHVDHRPVHEIEDDSAARRMAGDIAERRAHAFFRHVHRHAFLMKNVRCN